MSKLYFKYGAMNAGKSTIILQTAYNYQERDMNVLLVKPGIDKKGDDKIVSRLGVERKVDIILSENELLSNLIDFNKKIHAIIIDEAQFLTKEQVNDLYEITKEKDIPILCYGLRCDFKMEPFEGSARLLELADEISELKTMCECGKKATQNLRLINGIPVFDGSQVEIDNSNEIKYKSVCGKCYIRLRKKYSKKI